MGFNCGIVGLPNVGKSTLFNALTQTALAQAANYPFCTIEPNVGRIAVSDERLNTLAKLAGSRQILPTVLEIVDIAGLVKGASKGEGLGNQFLGNIRSVDAILHVVRCFNDDNVIHVEGSLDPIRDLKVIELELLFADLESVEKRIYTLEKKAKMPDSKIRLEVLEKLKLSLNNGIPTRFLSFTPEESILVHEFQLLTKKPVLYVCNVSEDGCHNSYTQSIFDYAKDDPVIIISAALEAEIIGLPTLEERKEFLKALGREETGLSQLVRSGFNLLNLITFFTVGPKEAHAWTTLKGSKAPKAAGVIHSDFEKGFICAEVISYDDFITYGGEQGAKAHGKARLEGKDYVMCDGDVVHFRFNV